MNSLNLTEDHDNPGRLVGRADKTADRRNNYSARTHTTRVSFPAEPGEDRQTGWYYAAGRSRKKHLAPTTVDYGQQSLQHTRRLNRPLMYSLMGRQFGVRPIDEIEYSEMWQELDPNDQAQLVARTYNTQEELREQARAAREPARPFDANHANRQTGFEKRNNRDKYIDPVGNPNEQQRLALEQSARFLPAELLHMIRPDRQPQQPLAQHPGYNSIPARTIRDRNAQPIPANHVHN